MREPSRVRDFAGVPDGFQRLWTPHRIAYIQDGQQPAQGRVRLLHRPDAERRAGADRRTAASTPTCCSTCSRTTAGTCSSCPYRHVAGYDEATAEEVAEIASLTQTAMRVLTATLALRRLQHRDEPGRDRRRRHRRAPAPAHRAAVGADSNFFPIIARTKALPRLLGEVRDEIAAAWPA